MNSSSRNRTALKIGCALVIGAMFSARASAQATAQASIKAALIKADRLFDPRSGSSSGMILPRTEAQASANTSGELL
jgi:hypothetical protein